MPRSIDGSQIDKGKVRLVGQDMSDGDVGDFVVAFMGGAGVALPGKLQRLRPAQVAQRFPVVDRRTTLAVHLGLIKQPGQRARHRLPDVSGDAMARRGNAVKNGHVAWQRDARHDRAGRKGPSAALAQVLQRWAVGRRDSIGPETVDHYEDYWRVGFHRRFRHYSVTEFISDPVWYTREAKLVQAVYHRSMASFDFVYTTLLYF